MGTKKAERKKVKVIGNSDARSNNGSLPLAIQKLIAKLESLPHDEVYTTQSMMRIHNSSRTTLGHYGTHPILTKYRYKGTDGRVLWGNPAAIKLYVEELNSES